MLDTDLGNANRIECMICPCIIVIIIISAPSAIITALTSWLFSSGFYEDFWFTYIACIFLQLFISVWMSEPRRRHLDWINILLSFSFSIVVTVKLLIVIFFLTLIAYNPEFYVNPPASVIAYLAIMGIVLTQDYKLFSRYLLVSLFVSRVIFVQLYSHSYFNQTP